MYPHAFIAALPISDLTISSHAPYRTYRYYNGSGTVGPALFPFGHGLSYSAFQSTCSGGPAIVSTSANFSIGIQCKTSNVGTGRAALIGDEILMVYHRAGDDVRAVVGGAHPVPLRSLRDFARLSDLVPGAATATASAFAFGPADLALVNATGAKILYPGTHYLEVSPRPPAAPFTLTVTVTGAASPVGPAPPLPPWDKK